MRLILSSLLVVMCLASLAQDSTKRIVVNSMTGPEEPLKKVIFKYPEFVQARLIYKDNGVSEARLNYHRYFQQLFFINEKNDTMVLARPELFSLFVLGKDSFYFHDKQFAFLVTHFSEVNLVKKEFISLIGKEKKGLYGTYSSVSSANSEKTFTSEDDTQTRWLQVDENALYKMEEKFLLKDKFNNLFTANKKNFYNLFSKHEKELKKYLEEKKVKYDNEEDLVTLLVYLNGL